LDSSKVVLVLASFEALEKPSRIDAPLAPNVWDDCEMPALSNQLLQR
jgi:hypothetical protein